MKNLTNKENYVKEIQQKLEKAKVVVLATVEGVNVDEMTLVRRNLRASGDELRVVKNTLFKRALHNLKIEGLDTQMAGSTAVAFGYADPAVPVKALYDFADKAKKFTFKGGLLGDKILTVKQLEQLSKLPGRKQLLGMLLSTMVGPIRNMVSVTQGPIRKLVYALEAIRQQKEKAAA